MNCPGAREIFPELLDHRASAGPGGPSALVAEARQHLANCPDCQREFSALSQTLAALDAMPAPAPSPRLRQNFYAMLEAEKHSAARVHASAAPEPRTPRTTRWRWILPTALAGVFALIGFQAGTRYAPATPAADEVTARKIAALEKQVGDVKKLVSYSILQQQQNPTNERLQDVLAAARADHPGEQVLATLVDALAFDPSTNVRLRALEALYRHADQERVRSGVLASLPREQNPLVQLEMIDFVASTRDRAATPALEEISQNEKNDLSVRDAARRALAQL